MHGFLTAPGLKGPRRMPIRGFMKKHLAVLLVVISAAVVCVPSVASAADVYESYGKIGRVTASYGGRYNVYEGYQKVGYVKASYGGRWDVYEGYRKLGYVKSSYGGRWNIYEGYSNVGYAKRSYSSGWDIYSGYSKVGRVSGGSGGPAAGAALLLLVG
jgi:hypothetical protein